MDEFLLVNSKNFFARVYNNFYISEKQWKSFIHRIETNTVLNDSVKDAIATLNELPVTTGGPSQTNPYGNSVQPVYLQLYTVSEFSPKARVNSNNPVNLKLFTQFINKVEQFYNAALVLEEHAKRYSVSIPLTALSRSLKNMLNLSKKIKKGQIIVQEQNLVDNFSESTAYVIFVSKNDSYGLKEGYINSSGLGRLASAKLGRLASAKIFESQQAAEKYIKNSFKTYQNYTHIVSVSMNLSHACLQEQTAQSYPQTLNDMIALQEKKRIEQVLNEMSYETLKKRLLELEEKYNEEPAEQRSTKRKM